jgi:hypothetical protein
MNTDPKHRFFGLKINKIFDADPRSFKSWNRDGKFRSGINIPDPQGVEGFSMSGTFFKKSENFDKFFNKKTKRFLSPNLKSKKFEI